MYIMVYILSNSLCAPQKRKFQNGINENICALSGNQIYPAGYFKTICPVPWVATSVSNRYDYNAVIVQSIKHFTVFRNTPEIAPI